MRVGSLLAVVACATVTMAAAPLESIRIKATQKTEDRKQGGDVAIGPAQAKRLDKVVFYKFELQRVTPAVPEDVTVKYVLLVSGPGGRIIPGASGERNLKLPVGQTVAIESDSVKLSGIQWEGAFAAGKARDEIHGYGVRVLDEKQNILAEKCEPKSVGDDVKKAFEKTERPVSAPPWNAPQAFDPRDRRPRLPLKR